MTDENRGGSGMSRAIFALSMVGMLGCAHKEETKPQAPTQAVAPAPASAPQAAAPKSDSLCATDLDCGASQLCLNQHCVDITSNLEACTNVRVHFPYNSDEMDSA